MKIVIDVFGADMPEEIVKGAITAVNLIDEVEIILTGDKDKIQKVTDKYTKIVESLVEEKEKVRTRD